MPTETASALELYLVNLINAERGQAGLEPVHVEVHLNSAAQDHSDWMAGEEAISHAGENDSTPTERVEDSNFPLAGGSWKLTENVGYKSVNGQPSEADMNQIHSALMDSPSHQDNILDPDVAYVGVGLAIGYVQAESGTQQALFVTQNFANSPQPVLVQEEIDGQTVVTTYVDGEAVPGTSELVQDDQDQPDDADEDEDPAGSRDDEQQEDQEKQEQSSSGGSCFVATAAYGNRLHPDVVALRGFRDQVLVRHRSGRTFIRLYWIVGPQMAKAVKSERISGWIARRALRPFVFAAMTVCRRQRKMAALRRDVCLAVAWRSE